ncbi:MAG: YggS family pyridoxal phosphate-dependent enzyme [Cryobacterium sp.]|nr:YggS family pyridoxal phosphate-dependent enzyme [Cryobacterium sp.]
MTDSGFVGLADRLARVRSDIDDAARAAGREPAELTTIVVTKFHPATLVRDLFELGVRDFGENRHQEAESKATQLRADQPDGLDLRWHFVGQLQSKKARAVRRYASVIHSLDRDSVLDALARAADEHTEPIDVLVQVNLTEDPRRGGVVEAELDRFVERAVAADGVRVRGVMGVAAIDAEPRAEFARLRGASERVREVEPSATWISGGMSGDFREAILEGATHLRIGTAITGNRPTAG